MPFSLSCTNKGCGQVQEPYLDLADDKVYCSLCNKEIGNITYFTKVQMKSMKQFKQKNTTSFSVKCVKCNRDGRPKLLNKEVVCGNCNKPLDNLSDTFKNMLKDKLREVDKDV